MLKLKVEKGSDEEEEEDEEVEEKVKELDESIKNLKKKKKIVELEAEIAKLEAEKSKYQPLADMSVSKQSDPMLILGLLKRAGFSPEEANEWLTKLTPEAVATLNALSTNNPYLPIFMFLQTRKGGEGGGQLTAKDVIEINKQMMELAKEKGGGSDQEMLKELTKQLIELNKSMTEKEIRDLKDRLDSLEGYLSGRSITLEKLIENPELIERLKPLLGGGGVDTKTMIELEKLKRQMDIELEKLRLERLKLMAELKGKKTRDRMLVKTFEKIGEGIARGLQAGVSEAEKMTYENPSENPSEMSNKYIVKCPKCGSDIDITNVNVGEIVECSSCHSKFKLKKK